MYEFKSSIGVSFDQSTVETAKPNGERDKVHPDLRAEIEVIFLPETKGRSEAESRPRLICCPHSCFVLLRQVSKKTPDGASAAYRLG